MNKSLLIAVAILVSLTAVLAGFYFFGPKPSGCGVVRIYSGTLKQTHSFDASGIGSTLQATARCSWTPVALEKDRSLFQFTLTNIALQGYPAPIASLAKATSALHLYVGVDQQGRLTLFSESDGHSSVMRNLALSFIEHFQFSTEATEREESDGIGIYLAKYGKNGAEILKRKEHYVRTHYRTPLPRILESRIEFYTNSSLLPDRVVSFNRLSQLADPTGRLAEIVEQAEVTHISTEDQTPEAVQACQSLTYEKAVTDQQLKEIHFAYQFENPSSPIQSHASSEELITQIKKAKKDPIKELENLTELLTTKPDEITKVTSQLRKIRNNEEKSAYLISALANTENEPAQAALREMIDYYLLKHLWRLAVRTIRAQQLSDYVDRETVLNLKRLSEDSQLPQKVRQSALLATGSTAAILGDEEQKQRLRVEWTNRIGVEKNELRKAEWLSAIGNLADPESVSFLTQLAASDLGYVGDQAIEALRLIRTAEAENALLDHTIHSKRSERRNAALQALNFAPLSQPTCERLMFHYHSLLQQFSASRESERILILSALTQSEHRDYLKVKEFILELSTSLKLPQKERDYVTHIQTTGF